MLDLPAPKTAVARFATIKEIDRAGFDLRLWCYACQHTKVLDGIIWARFEERGLALELDQVRRHFPCSRCGARDCLIVPATSQSWRPKDAMSVAAAWFFAGRSAAKRRRF
jgi:hypothetical protein